MKFSIDKETLSDVMQVVGPVAQKSGVMEILSNVCIIVSNNVARFVSTDGMATVDLSIPVESDSDGGICINAANMLSLSKVMEDGELLFELMPNNVTVKITESNGSVTEVSTTDYSAFPFPKEHKSAYSLTVNGDKLSHMLNKGAKFVSSDETRVALTGLHLAFDSELGTITLSSTDSYKMFSSHCPADGTGQFQVVLPFHAAQVLEKLINDIEANDIEIKFDDSFMSVDIGGANLSSKLIDTPYPDLSNIFGVSRNDKMTMSKTDFVKFLRRSSIITKKDVVPQINIAVSKNKVAFESVNTKGEKVAGSIPCSCTLSEDYKFSLNVNQIQSIMPLIKSKDVGFEFATDEDENFVFVGIFIIDHNHKNDIYVIMPLR